MADPITFQTIGEYLATPFGQKSTEKNKMYNSYLKLRNKIAVEGLLEKEGNYLVHVTVPSESNKDQVYDVVILFFTDDDSVKKSYFLDKCYVKFFSNSPSFIYQYAVLYHKAGYLIDFLFEKMDKNYADKMPKNPKPLSYDKSLFCACQYLVEPKFDHINRTGLLRRKKKTEAQFFRDIKTFENVKLNIELNTLNKKIDKEMEEKKKRDKAKKTPEEEKKEEQNRMTTQNLITAAKRSKYAPSKQSAIHHAVKKSTVTRSQFAPKGYRRK